MTWECRADSKGLSKNRGGHNDSSALSQKMGPLSTHTVTSQESDLYIYVYIYTYTYIHIEQVKQKKHIYIYIYTACLLPTKGLS